MSRSTTKQTPLYPRSAIWIVYVDGNASIWCTTKEGAEEYRKWGRRKRPQRINIRKYILKTP